MYTIKLNQKLNKNGLESSKQDILENQTVTFHVEHKTMNNNVLDMKKFEVIRENSKEYFFANDKIEAEKMVQLHLKVREEANDIKEINEVEFIIHQ